MNNEIAILMATYNGCSYLEEQLDSIFRQTYENWHLYVHDDGSTDSTVEILKRYLTGNPEKMTILNYPSQHGTSENFMSMLEHVEACYYMFCDQDDVWLENKIELSIKSMLSQEKDKNIPVVVHTDLIIVDEHLQEIYHSLWQYMDIRPSFMRSFHDCIISYVTGCTMLINKTMRDISIQIPRTHALMHDSWITACCHHKKGLVISLRTPSVLYRQHSNNVLGAIAASRITLKYRMSNFCDMQKTNWHFLRMLNSIAPFPFWKFAINKFRYKIYLKSHEA